MLTQTSYHQLKSHTNVYSTCTFMHRGDQKVLVVTNRAVHVFKHDMKDGLVPEEPLTPARLFPNGEIVSVDAFDPLGEETPIVGIAGVGAGTSVLNVYGVRCRARDSLEKVFADCLQIQLSFVPFVLKHTPVLHHNKRPDFLLSGSDRQIHVYRQKAAHREFEELCPGQDKHPLDVLGRLPSCVLSLDIREGQGGEWFLAVGCQDGLVRMVSSSADTYSEQRLDGPAAALKIFSPARGVLSLPPRNPGVGPPSKVQKVTTRAREHEVRTRGGGKQRKSSSRHAHVLVGGAVGFGAILHDMQGRSGGKRTYLPQSDEVDSVLAVHHADLNLDGVSNVILGTYGQELLVYERTDARNPGCLGTEEEKKEEREPEKDDRVPSYTLSWHTTLAHPINHICGADLDADGLEEVVVTSMYGVHEFRLDAVRAFDAINTTLEVLQEIEELEAMLETGDVVAGREN